jgi:CBS domain-containing protein
MPRTIVDSLIRDAPVVAESEPVGRALELLLDCRLPAIPVVGDGGRYAGIFGEREFITALFPGYLKELNYAGFVPQSLDKALDKRQSCRHEPVSQHMNSEHVDVGEDYSDAQLAETFLHHRVLIVPVIRNGKVAGVITRSAFFCALAERFLEKGQA